MGNYRFKLSNVTPLAWIYKLKEMGRPKNSSNTTPHQPNNEKQPKTKGISESPQPKPPSYNFTTSEEDFVLVSPAAIDHKTKFSSPPTITHQSSLKKNSFLPPPETPRKSSKTRHPSKTEFHRKFSAPCACKCYCHAPTSRPESPPEHFSLFPPDPNSVIGSYTKGASCLHATTKLKMHAKEETSLGHFHKHLPRISAKPAKFVQIGKKIIAQENNCRTRASMRTPGVGAKIRLSSPRTGGRKIQMVSCRKSMGSVAIAKETCDPYRDFMESMMAMIVEYKIRAPGDLEDLLVRYLSLNSNEYHEIIVKVFKQIWILLNDA